MATKDTNTKAAPNDGVIRRGDADKEGVQVGDLYVFRVSETGEQEPGEEKDRNGQPRKHCGMTGVKGFLVSNRVNASRFKGEKGEFEMLEVCLTQAAYGIKGTGADAEIKLLAAGKSLLVPCNHALGDLVKYAEHDTHTVEVVIIPGDKATKPTAKGFYPRNWEIRAVSKEVVERKTIKGFASLPALPSAQAGFAALPTGDTNGAVSA